MLPEDILETCLRDVRSGKCSVEACLQRFPEYRKELEPLLRLALALSEVAVDIDAHAQQVLRARLMQRIAAPASQPTGFAMRRAGMMVLTTFLLWMSRVLPRTRWMALVGALVLVAVVFLAGSGVVYAANEALPNQPLYGVKLTVERVRLRLTPSPEAKIQMHLTFARRRLNELEALVQKGIANGLERALTNYEWHVEQALQLAQAHAAAQPEVWAHVWEQVQDHEQRLQQLGDALPRTDLNAMAVQAIRQTHARVHRWLQQYQRPPMAPLPNDTPSPSATHPDPEKTPPCAPASPAQPSQCGQGQGKGQGQGQGKEHDQNQDKGQQNQGKGQDKDKQNQGKGQDKDKGQQNQQGKGQDKGNKGDGSRP